jgi:ABC-type amino acid transport substrate-binding protein
MRFPIIGLIALLFLGCEMPCDPEGTYERVHGGVLRVGISPNGPWTRSAPERPTGIEVELLEQLARRLNARLEWVDGSETELLEKLEGGSLDVVVGGLKKDTPWSKRVGLTQPFLTLQRDHHVMAVRQGENRWLLELDKFLQSHRGAALQLYRREVTP